MKGIKSFVHHSFFKWSLTVSGLNHVNTPYKTTNNLRFLKLDYFRLKARIRFEYLYEKLGGGIQTITAWRPGDLIACFYNQIWTSLFDKMGENLYSNKLFGSLMNHNTTFLKSSFRNRSDTNQPFKIIHPGISPPVYYTLLDIRRKRLFESDVLFDSCQSVALVFRHCSAEPAIIESRPVPARCW